MSWVSRHRYKLLPTAVALALVTAALVERERLSNWFSNPKRHASHAPTASASAPASSTVTAPVGPGLGDSARAALNVALEAYEDVRSRLAADSIDELAPRARRIAEALRSAHQSVLDQTLKPALDSGAKAADELAAAGELASARRAFGEVSRTLVAALSADQAATRDYHIFECPMVEGYRKWIQPNAELRNPYMGQKMLKCGSATQWDVPKASARGLTPSAANEIAHYTCPMHPSIKQPGPGKCPICGMDLSPVTKGEVQTGVIFVDAERRQLIGVKTARVETKLVDRTIRSVGKITYDEERLVDVSLKFQGWVEKLFADTTGQPVRKGQPLLTVYSPDIYAAAQELLIASGRARAASGDEAGKGGNFLLDSAKQRLRLWDVPEAQIEQIIQKGEVSRTVPIASPASGFIIEKNVVAGAAVEAGARLFRIANLDKVWIQADLYESELPLIRVGQEASVTLPYLPGTKLTGKVSFIYPYLSGSTRTGQVRIEIDNRKIELKPDMYATVELQVKRGEHLVVPESAVIYSGPRRIVFLDLGEGKLKPQEIQIGIKVGDFYEVMSGLKTGDVVVTSGNFLIAAESRLKSAEGVW